MVHYIDLWMQTLASFGTVLRIPSLILFLRSLRLLWRWHKYKYVILISADLNDYQSGVGEPCNSLDHFLVYCQLNRKCLSKNQDTNRGRYVKGVNLDMLRELFTVNYIWVLFSIVPEKTIAFKKRNTPWLSCIINQVIKLTNKVRI